MMNEGDKSRQLLCSVETKFGHETWFTNIRALATKAKTKQPQKTIKAPAARFIGENTQALKLIESLVAALEEKGAVFHPDLRFVEQGGELSIKSFVQAEQQPVLISIPLDCMPLLCDYSFSIEDDLLKVNSNKQQISPNNQYIMQLMVELYNCTNKIQAWQTSHPLLSLKDHPELVDYLYKHVKKSAKLVKHKLLFDQGRWHALIIDSFIGSREFNFTQQQLASSGIEIKNTIEKGLLTIIDLLNHKYGENGYLTNEQTGALNIINKPNEKTQEVSVHYNKLDPLLSYLIYGFVDSQAPILHSIPSTIKCLSGVEFIVMGSIGRTQSEIIEMAPHLEEYLPSGFMREGNSIIVRNLFIPNRSAKHTLHEVIKLILLDCDVEHIYRDQAMLEQELHTVIKQLCVNNLKYWQDFATLVNLQKFESIPKNTKDDLKTLINFSIDHLKNYMQANQVTIF